MTDQKLQLELSSQVDKTHTTEIADVKKIETANDVDTALKTVEESVIFTSLAGELEKLATNNEKKSLTELLFFFKEKQKSIFDDVLSKHYISLADGTKREYLWFQKVINSTSSSLIFDISKAKKEVEALFIAKFMKKWETVFNNALVEAKKNRTTAETDTTKKEAIKNEKVKQVNLDYTVDIKHDITDTTTSTKSTFRSHMLTRWAKFTSGEVGVIGALQWWLGNKQPADAMMEAKKEGLSFIASLKNLFSSWKDKKTAAALPTKTPLT